MHTILPIPLLLLAVGCATPPPSMHHNPVVKVQYLGVRQLTRAEASARKVPPGLKESYVANGSGFLANGAGDIVTNHHVVAQAGMETQQIVVTIDGEWMYPATLVHSDSSTDLAVIRIDADDATLLPILRLGRDSVAGDAVVLRGYPGGGAFQEEQGRVMRTGRLLECAISVAVGNSGGPLLSEDGTVAGVVTGMRKRTFGGRGGGGVTAEFCLVIPVETLRRQLANWRVAHP